MVPEEIAPQQRRYFLCIARLAAVIVGTSAATVVAMALWMLRINGALIPWRPKRQEWRPGGTPHERRAQAAINARRSRNDTAGHCLELCPACAFSPHIRISARRSARGFARVEIADPDLDLLRQALMARTADPRCADLDPA